MRIIITSKGKNEVRDLEYLTEKKRNKTVSYGKQFRRTFTINKSKDNPLSKKKRTETEMGKTVRPSVMMASPFSALSTDQSMIDKGTLKKAKKIHLKLAKLNFSKRVTDKYESERGTSEKIIEDKENSPEMVKLKQRHNKYQKYSLGEILGKSAVIGIKKKLIKEDLMRDRLSRIDENKFRSTYENYTNLEKLEHILEYKKINPANTNLIRFVNEKKTIPKEALKKIVQFDHNQIFKANKICQTLFVHEEQDQIFKEVMNKKIKVKHTQERVEFDKSLKEMNKDITLSNRIFSGYSNKVDKMEKYREKHTDIEKQYWEKFHIDELLRKTNKKRNSQTETQVFNA